MVNVETKIQDDRYLIIRIDLEQDNGSSKSGKTKKIASTQGFMAIGNDGIILNLNCNKKI